MLSTKNLPVDKFKLSKLLSKLTGPCKVLEHNPGYQYLTLDFFDFPDFTNISNTFHISHYKHFPANDDIHVLERKLNRPGPVEEDRWEVEQILEIRS